MRAIALVGGLITVAAQPPCNVNFGNASFDLSACGGALCFPFLLSRMKPGPASNPRPSLPCPPSSFPAPGPLRNLVGAAGFTTVDFRDPTKFYKYNFCSACALRRAGSRVRDTRRSTPAPAPTPNHARLLTHVHPHPLHHSAPPQPRGIGRDVRVQLRQQHPAQLALLRRAGQRHVARVAARLRVRAAKQLLQPGGVLQ